VEYDCGKLSQCVDVCGEGMKVQVLENVLPDHVRRSALAAFPLPAWEHWHKYQNGKLASVDQCRVPPACRIALEQLAVNIPLEQGFFDLSLHGAGMHLMPAGTHLGEHKDATHHPRLNWKRLESLVYFLEDGEGGELIVEGQAIVPRKNTAVIFAANQSHSVTMTLRDRKTLSLFVFDHDEGVKGTTTATFTEVTT